jgi:hypothetical protein
LKVIVHEAEAVMTRLHGFEKLAGEDVIITHRLLKNSIQADEYMAAIDSFTRLLEVTDDQPQVHHANCHGIGNIELAVFCPQPAAHPPQPTRATAAMANTIRLEFHAARRILLRGPRRRPRQLSRSPAPARRDTRVCCHKSATQRSQQSSPAPCTPLWSML